MWKYVLLILLMATSVKAADRTVLFFHYDGCRYCPIAEKMLTSKEIAVLINKYDNNYSIDTKKNPEWKDYYKIKSVPTVIIADITVRDKKAHGVKLYQWQLGGSEKEAKERLRQGLVLWTPKKQEKPVIEFLQEVKKRIFP